MNTQTPQLSLQQLEAFDPHAASGSGERRFLCPLCGLDKPKDSAHRSLSLNSQSCLWHCFRCDARGKLRDAWDEGPALGASSRLRRELQRAFTIPPLPTQASSSHDVPSDDLSSVEAHEPQVRLESEVWKRQLKSLQSLQATPGESYLCGRSVSLAIAEAGRVRYAPSWFGRPAVVFPLYNEQSRLVAAQGRYVDGQDDPKTRTAGARKPGVFVSSPDLWLQVRRGAPVVITEAPMDALSIASCGFPALALCGKSGWPTWLAIRCAFQRVLVAFDADEAGDSGAEPLMAALASLGAKASRLRPPDETTGGKDWNELLQRLGTEALTEWLAPAILT